MLDWSPFVILGVSGLFCHFCTIFDRKTLLTNKVDPDQMPHYVASDQGLLCFPMTLLWGFQVRMVFTYKRQKNGTNDSF